MKKIIKRILCSILTITIFLSITPQIEATSEIINDQSTEIVLTIMGFI